jgi:predicted ArsR family transcriptional regulator
MSDKMSDNDAVSDKNYRETLLAYIRENGEISAIKAAELIGRNPKTARRELLQLVDEGLVIAIGGNRNRKYKVRG